MTKNVKKIILYAVIVSLILSSFLQAVGALKSQYRLDKSNSYNEFRGLFYYRGNETIIPSYHQGWINSTPTSTFENTSCGAWIWFEFNGEGDYSGEQMVRSIYYHTWWGEPIVSGWLPMHTSSFKASYNTTGGNGPFINDTIDLYHNDYITEVNRHRLLIGLHITNPEYSSFTDGKNFSSCFAGANINMVMAPHFCSFVIFNLPCNETLNATGLLGQGLDSDSDGLSDWEELFVYYTNPVMTDTDNDGFSDGYEVEQGWDPNNYTSPGIDPHLSSVDITFENMNGLFTCPFGDGPALKHIVVTLRNALDMPLYGIPASAISFSLEPGPETYWFGEMSCTFIPKDQSSNENGELYFEIVADTSISGNISSDIPGHITIEVSVYSIPLSDIVAVPCRSADYNINGNIGLSEFILFANDLSSGYLRSDFDFNNIVNIVDFVLFHQHFRHTA